MRRHVCLALQEIMQLENTWSAVAQWEGGFGKVQSTTLVELRPAALEALCGRVATLLDMEGVQQWPVWQDTDVRTHPLSSPCQLVGWNPC